MRIREVVGHIRSAANITFVLGAGASRSAGIPTAPGLVAMIEEQFAHCISGLSTDDRKNYGKAMGTLSPADRKRLIEPLLAGAKLNWGHVALARIVQATQVRRILSFNFDFLMEKATALMGEHLPVYDFGVSPTRHVTGLADKAIFHLHGQSYGMTLLNTIDETKAHAEKLRPLLSDSLRNHLTVVAGYSGEADAAFSVMVDSYDSNNNLIWLGHEADPKPHLRLLVEQPYACYIGGCDFDQTMIEIAQGLGCWPIPLIENPPKHTLSLLELLPPFPVGSEQLAYVLGDTKKRLLTSSDEWKLNRTNAEKLAEDLISGHDGNLEIDVSLMEPEAIDLAALRLFSLGNKRADEAGLLTGDMKTKKLAEAGEGFARALELRPEMLEALCNWGNILSLEASTLSGKQRSKKILDAKEKYLRALELEPADSEVLYNLGLVLEQEAEDLKGVRRTRKLIEAHQRYQSSLAVSPNDFETLVRSGEVLVELSDGFKGEERRKWLSEARAKFHRALAINSDNSDLLDSWGNLLLRESYGMPKGARERNFLEAERFLERARELSKSGNYNLACIYAITNRLELALAELEACERDGSLPELSHIQKDPDLSKLKGERRFVDFLERQTTISESYIANESDAKRSE